MARSLMLSTMEEKVGCVCQNCRRCFRKGTEVLFVRKNGIFAKYFSGCEGCDYPLLQTSVEACENICHCL